MTPLFERILIAALAWGAFSFGAVYPWGYWPLAAVALVLGSYWLVTTRAWEDPRTRRLGLALLAVAVAIGLQLVALPYSVVSALSPAFDRFFLEYSVAYHPAALHALSIDPPATLRALVLFVAFSVLLIGLTRALRVIPLDALANQITGLGIALAVVGVVQKALIDPQNPLVYGFWEPLQGGSPGRRASTPFGPFINRNHFAGWMVMALPLVVGFSYGVLLTTRRAAGQAWPDRLRWLTTVEANRFLMMAFAALLMGMAVVLTGSRSGIAGLLVAMVALAYLVLRQAKGRQSRRLVAGYLAVILGGAVLWAGTDATVGRFLLARTDSAGRLSAWQDTWRIIQDFPAAGTGMGTFAQAMLVYQTADRPVMYAQAHNEYLQVLAEGGLLVALPAGVALVLVLGGIRRRLTVVTDDPMSYWIRAGAVAGLLGIAAQSAVEFSLQMPGNAVLFVVLLATALHRGRGDARPSSRLTRAQRSMSHAHRV